jgi:hypothetical protein
MVDIRRLLGTLYSSKARISGDSSDRREGWMPVEGEEIAMDELGTAEQAAAALRLTLKTLQDWLRASTLMGCKVGRPCRVGWKRTLRHSSRCRMWCTQEENAKPASEQTLVVSFGIRTIHLR